MRIESFAFVCLALSASQAHSACLEGALGRGCFRPAPEFIPGAISDTKDGVAQLNPMQAIKVAFPLAEEMIKAVAASNIPVLDSAAQNMAAIGTKLDKETQTAITNALTNPSKGIRDAAQTALKAANDTIDAADAAKRYGERMVSGSGEILSKAESRLREGKVVDAVWHLGTDQVELQNDNAAKVMEESEIARQAAEKAAAAYGGPAGAAAFAAWYAYNTSKGDVGKALFAGTYAYVVSSGNAEVGKMPTATVSEVVKKAATVAAVRGLAVGAAGGTQKEMLDAMAQSGGEVIVQSGQAYVTKNYTDPAKARADAFCLDQMNETCSDAMQWVDDTKKQVEEYEKVAAGRPTVVVTGDGQWAVSWNKQALVNSSGKAPGVVLTYVGQGSIYRNQVLALARTSIPEPLPPKEEKKTVKPAVVIAPPVPRVPAKTYPVTFHGILLNDKYFPLSRSRSNQIKFSIDGKYENTAHPLDDDEMDDFTVRLTSGTHVFAFSVRVRSAEGGYIDEDCTARFTVSGAALYSPYLTLNQRTESADGLVSDCSLMSEAP